MRNLFNPESLVWKPLGFLGDLVVLSLLWVVCSVPVVTLGPASAALYDAAVHSLRRKEDLPFERFFATFRRELKEGVLATLIWLGITAVFVTVFFALLRFVPACAEHWPLMLAAALILGFFLLCIQCWLWPTLSRFTLGLRALHGAALRLAFGHILRSAAMAVLWGAALYAGLRWIAPSFVCPGLAAFLSTWVVEPVFRRYEQAETQGNGH